MSADSPNPDREPPPVHWHALAPDQVLDRLEVGAEGLTDAEVERRRQHYGANLTPQTPPASALALYVKQYKNPFIYLLFGATALSLAVFDVADALFIFVVLQTNAVIGMVQESRAEHAARALGKLVASWAVALRDGIPSQIPAEQLVPGDRVTIEAGMRVPADIRLLSAQELVVDESLLTGESGAVAKLAMAKVAVDAGLGDRSTMLYAATTVMRGRGEGVVVATATGTEFGRIAESLVAGPRTEPPLVQRMARFSRTLALVMGAVILLLAAIEFSRGGALAEVLLLGAALAVAAVPEGLPVAMTVALSLGLTRMARRQVVIRQLPAVEGLGACTMIASDKTGTLTVNELTVRRLWLPGCGEVEVSGEGYRPDGNFSLGGRPLAGAALEAARGLAEAGMFSNDASYRVREHGAIEQFGDSVDVAFLVLGHKLGLDRAELVKRYPRLATIPYAPERRFGASFERADAPGQASVMAHVKGAAETVLPFCRGIDTKLVLEQAARLAGLGYRVIAVAAGPVGPVDDPAGPVGPVDDPAGPVGPVDDQVTAERLQNLDFLGLAGLIDPLRDEVPAAVRACHRAGIEVCMITGDHPGTALAIARELGIADRPEQVVTGAELAALGAGSERLRQAVARARVFARVEPVQKLEIVGALRANGHFVAVTGDGVNDAPALQAADIGVAMGRSGTDIARQAADLILTDDNFASLVAGIEQGRIAYDNLRKVILLLVGTGFGEIGLFVLASLAGLPPPLTAVQLLWLNVVTESLQHIGLGAEKGEPGVLARRPRPPSEPIFDRPMIAQVLLASLTLSVASFALYAVLLARGWSLPATGNLLLLLFVLFENAMALNFRSETRSLFRIPLSTNPLLIAGVIGAQAIHIGAMWVPGLNVLLGIAPVAFSTWLAVAAIAAALVAVMEVYKLVAAGTWRDPGKE